MMIKMISSTASSKSNH